MKMPSNETLLWALCFNNDPFRQCTAFLRRVRGQVPAHPGPFLTNLLARARYRLIDPLLFFNCVGGAAGYCYVRLARARRFVRRAYTTCENRLLSGSHVPLPSRPVPACDVRQSA